MRNIIALFFIIVITACGSTLNTGELDSPDYTTTEVVYEGVTWHGEYYNDRWNWSVE